MAKIGLPKGSGKRLKVREKSVKSQGILKWILSGNPGLVRVISDTLCYKDKPSLEMKIVRLMKSIEPCHVISNNVAF